MNSNFTPTGVDVSIVVCTKNRDSLLDAMLTSLKPAARGVSLEVIVVEGGSTDQTRSVLRKHNITQVFNEFEHFGPGRHSWPQLYNFGFARARGRYAMYASDDIVFGPDSMTQAVRYLDSLASSVAGGIFFYKNLHTRPDWDKFGIDFTYGHKLLMNYGLIRMDAFSAVGGIDESYLFYCADGDLCYKLYQSGRQLVPLPGCFVLHNNVLDNQKNTNAQTSAEDIARYLDKWRHFVSTEEPTPRRLLWSDEMADILQIPAFMRTPDASIEHLWKGLAQIQYRQGNAARDSLMRAVSGGCDHPLIRKWIDRCGPPLPVAPSKPAVWPDGELLSRIQRAGLWSPGKPLRLHLGCGQWKFDGYVNIDYPPSEHTTIPKLGADIHADITTLRFPDRTVDEIRLHHVFEHFNRVTALALLIRWHQWLRVGGVLCIETPDLIGSARTLLSNAAWKTKMAVVRHLAGDQAAKWAYHVDHWFAERFQRTLSALGFGGLHKEEKSWSQEPFLSNVIVTAHKTEERTVDTQFSAAGQLLAESMVSPKERPTWDIWMRELQTLLADNRMCTSEFEVNASGVPKTKASEPLVSGGVR
ncbi:MAG: glycosyltransferase [Phycisphaerae bacterium]|nr:glycosyltransferase [Phycisphaerae bacterium]